MSAPEQTQHPFKCVALDDNDQQTVVCGGSYDNISAVTIACAVYQASQAVAPITHPDMYRRVAVLDTTDTIIAVVGAKNPVAGPV